jgi:hypothetical protein
MNKHFINVWAIPVAIAFVTIFGLLSSLLGTGIWHILSWIAMVIPLAIILRKIKG